MIGSVSLTYAHVMDLSGYTLAGSVAADGALGPSAASGQSGAGSESDQRPLAPYRPLPGSPSKKKGKLSGFGADTSISVSADEDDPCKVTLLKCLAIDVGRSRNEGGCGPVPGRPFGRTDPIGAQREMKEKLEDAFGDLWSGTKICPCGEGSTTSKGQGCSVTLELKIVFFNQEQEVKKSDRSSKRDKEPPENCAPVVVFCDKDIPGGVFDKWQKPSSDTDGLTSPGGMAIKSQASKIVAGHEIGHSLGIDGDGYGDDNMAPPGSGREGQLMSDPSNPAAEVAPEEVCLIAKSLQAGFCPEETCCPGSKYEFPAGVPTTSGGGAKPGKTVPQDEGGKSSNTRHAGSTEDDPQAWVNFVPEEKDRVYQQRYGSASHDFIVHSVCSGPACSCGEKERSEESP